MALSAADGRLAGRLRHGIAGEPRNAVNFATAGVLLVPSSMTPARKVVRIRRAATAEPLLPANEVDDMLDVFAMGDAEVVRVDLNVIEKPETLPESGFRRKVVAPPHEDEIEELTDGISEGWEDEDVA